jgi:hypothetical protein
LNIYLSRQNKKEIYLNNFEKMIRIKGLIFTLQPSQVITPKCKPEEAPPQTAHEISLNETN